MSSQNVATTLVYMAYNTSTGAYVTGDQANHTLKLIKDGTEASPTNASVEVDSTNTPGAYKLALTAAETQFGTVWLGGKSSTANVIIVPITATFEILPTALDANNMVKADVEDWKGTAVVSPATAGVPDINVKNYNNQTAATDANNLPKVDVADWNATAVGALPTNFSSLVINGSGAVSVQSNVKKNTALNNFPFTMTDSTTHSPVIGKTVAVQVSLDGAAFVNATNTPATEVSNGDYKINLAAADTNANTVQMRFTATGCDDLNIILITDP